MEECKAVGHTQESIAVEIGTNGDSMRTTVRHHHQRRRRGGGVCNQQH